MKLVIDELVSTLSQTFNLLHEGKYIVSGIRPYIYMHNNPAGTFTFKVKKGGVELVIITFDSSDIKTDLSTVDNYAHIWKKLTLSSPLAFSKGEHELELTSSGYSYSDDSYLGWVREHENLTNTIAGTPVSDIENPRAFQFFTLKEER